MGRRAPGQPPAAAADGRRRGTAARQWRQQGAGAYGSRPAHACAAVAAAAPGSRRVRRVARHILAAQVHGVGSRLGLARARRITAAAGGVAALLASLGGRIAAASAAPPQGCARTRARAVAARRAHGGQACAWLAPESWLQLCVPCGLPAVPQPRRAWPALRARARAAEGAGAGRCRVAAPSGRGGGGAATAGRASARRLGRPLGGDWRRASRRTAPRRRQPPRARCSGPGGFTSRFTPHDAIRGPAWPPLSGLGKLQG